MSFSREWTEHHLTPRGWESGSECTDGVGTKLQEPPADRVVTWKWLEEQTSPYSKMYRGGEVIWKSEDQAKIDELQEKFGPPPNSL